MKCIESEYGITLIKKIEFDRPNEQGYCKIG
jgi:hypothetical protein